MAVLVESLFGPKALEYPELGLTLAVAEVDKSCAAGSDSSDETALSLSEAEIDEMFADYGCISARAPALARSTRCSAHEPTPTGGGGLCVRVRSRLTVELVHLSFSFRAASPTLRPTKP